MVCETLVADCHAKRRGLFGFNPAVFHNAFRHSFYLPKVNTQSSYQFEDRRSSRS